MDTTAGPSAQTLETAPLVPECLSQAADARGTTLVVPPCVDVPESAFASNTQITSVVLPSGVLWIGPYAFHGCSRLQSIAFPNGLVTIGDHAFDQCVSLENIDLPASVREIHPSAFAGCERLTTVSIPRHIWRIERGVFSRCSSLSTVAFPEGLTRIECGAFNQCNNLASLVLPKGLAEIEMASFRGCESLVSVEVPATVLSIDAGAFADCSWLVTLTMPSGALKVRSNEYGFSVCPGCCSLQHVIAPALVGSMRDYFDSTAAVAFEGPRDDTPVTRHMAHRLRYWSRQTHGLCQPRRRQWVVGVVMAVHRLRDQDLRIPLEMVLAILEFLRRDHLGP
eukprot:m.137988 g.137988  ORF g.137988 m.137988 type:complete len:338 (-) comp13990_c0_seq2:1624-2637(-)